jgi:predicted transcriptional regulator
MSIGEIRNAITQLNARDKALLTAELFALDSEPDDAELEAALQRGLADVEAGRVHEIEDVKKMIPRWTSKS